MYKPPFSRKYRHKSTRHFVTDSPRRLRTRKAFPWRPVLSITLSILLVLTVAFVWGSSLKRKSDAYRASVEKNAWTLDTQVVPLSQVHVPDFRGPSFSPGEALGRVTAHKAYTGVFLHITQDADGTLNYALPLAEHASLRVAEGAPTLSSEASRIHAAGLTVTGIYEVRCMDIAYTSQPALFAYQRGLDMGIIVHMAEAGVDDILLVGLPYGDDATDAQTIDFLTECKQLLEISSVASRSPAIGVLIEQDGLALRLHEAESHDDLPSESEEDMLFAGRMTPSRLLTVCDYLVLDIRDIPPEQADEILKKVSYAYVRYSLRLMSNHPDVISQAELHGFTRIMEQLSSSSVS